MKRAINAKILLLGAAFGVFMVFCFWLASGLSLRFDEAYNLAIPKSLVEYGRYATLSGEGFRDFDPAVTTGPPVLLPVALSFKLFGIGLFQARIIMILFLAAYFWVQYVFVQSWFGERTAIISLFLLALATPMLYFFGVTVLGEIPGTLFLLLGMHLWIKNIESREIGRRQVPTLLAAGLFFGMAALTKSQFIITWPVLAIILIVGYQRRAIDWRRGLIPFVSAAALLVAWALLQTVQLQANNAAHTFHDLASNLYWSSVPERPSISRTIQHFQTLNESISLPSLGVSLGLIVYSATRRGNDTPTRIMQLALISIVVIWSFWWLFVLTRGFIRHLLPALLLVNVLLAWGILRLFSALVRFVKEDGILSRKFVAVTVIVVLLVAHVSVLADHSLRSTLDMATAASVERSAQASFVRSMQDLEPDASLYGFQWWMAWDIAFLSGRTVTKLTTPVVPEAPQSAYLLITPDQVDWGGDSALKSLIEQNGPPVLVESEWKLYRLSHFEP